MQEVERLQHFKQRVWEAIVKGSVPALEQVVWELITFEVHSKRYSFRQPLVQALDGSDLATEAHRNELLQRFAAQSGAGDTGAQCLIGILLCFQGGQGNESAVMPAHGVKFLHAAAERHNNLATLLLALCFECGKGVEVSTDAAKQCYSMAATRGYQMAQIFLKELMRDNPVANHQVPQLQLQNNIQAAGLGTNLGSLGSLGNHNAMHSGLGPQQGLRNSQFNPAQGHQQFLQAGQQVGSHAAQGLGGMQYAGMANSIDHMNSTQPSNMQEFMDQQVVGVSKKLQSAVHERNPQALALAVELAQEVSTKFGRHIAELNEACSILSFIREHHRFPESAQVTRVPSRGPSPAPSHRSTSAANTVPASPVTNADGRSPTAPPDMEQKAVQPQSTAGQQPTAAERGDAFFTQGGIELEIPLEPLEQDVDKTPSEQPLPTDVHEEDLADLGPAKPPVQASAEPEQPHPSPAVAIPRRGTSSHGSIGDRRNLTGNGGSVADSEPPLTREALDMFNLAGNAGSRSAPNSHRDTFDRLSVASLQSLQANQPAAESGGDTEKDKSERKVPTHDDKHLSRSASTGPPSPTASVQAEAVRRTQSALGTREEEERVMSSFGDLNLAGLKTTNELSEIERLMSAEDLATLASKGISIQHLKEAFSSTADPEKLRAYAQGIHQLIEPKNGSKTTPASQQAAQEQPNDSASLNTPLASPFGAVAGQLPTAPAAKSAPAVTQPNAAQNEEWGKLMQALHGNVTGLEGETLNDYLHNLRVLTSEDPNNDMVVPPTQSIPGVEAVLGALQAHGAPPQQQAEAMQWAARGQGNGQINLAALGQQSSQQRLGQVYGQGLPQQFHGLGNDAANSYGSGASQNLLSSGQGLGSNSLAYNQINNFGGRQYPQMVNAMAPNYGQPSAQDMSRLLNLNSQSLGNRLPNGNPQAQSMLGGTGVLPQQLMPQGRTLGGQSSLLANYNGLNNLYGSKPGLNNLTTTPGILGATASMKNNANRFHPGLPTKPLPPDLHRSMMAQSPVTSNNLTLGMGNLNSGLGGTSANPWATAVAPGNRYGGSMLNNRTLASQGLPNNYIGSSSLGNPGIQGLQGFQANIGLQTGPHNSIQTNNMQSLQQGGMDLQGLPNSAAFQNLRVNEQMQGSAQPTANQAPKADPQNPSYSLFKLPSSSMTPGQSSSSQMQGFQASPSQQILSENLWSTSNTPQAQQPQASPFMGQTESGQTGQNSSISAYSASLAAQSEKAAEANSASLGILTKDAEMQARLNSTWGSSGAMSLSQGFSSQPPTSLAGWNSSGALQLQQGKGVSRPYYPSALGLGAEDSLTQAFRQKPPRPAGVSAPFSSQPQLTLRNSASGNSLGLFGQPQGLMNAGSSYGGEGGSPGAGLGGLGGNLNQANTGFTSSLGSGLGANPATSGSLTGARISSLLNQPRPNRFPGQNF